MEYELTPVREETLVARLSRSDIDCSRLTYTEGLVMTCAHVWLISPAVHYSILRLRIQLFQSGGVTATFCLPILHWESLLFSTVLQVFTNIAEV